MYGNLRHAVINTKPCGLTGNQMTSHSPTFFTWECLHVAVIPLSRIFTNTLGTFTDEFVSEIDLTPTEGSP